MNIRRMTLDRMSFREIEFTCISTNYLFKLCSVE
jgi:hypothetical protein